MFESAHNHRWFFACIVVLVVCFACLAGLRGAAMKVGLVDIPGGRKRHGEPVPLLGGIAIMFSMIAGFALMPSGIWPVGFIRGFFLATIIIGVTGVLDDLKELSAIWKLVLQFSAISALCSISGVSLSNLGAIVTDIPIQLAMWSIPVTVVALIGLMNAINMVDGIDGLLGSAALVTTLCLAYVAKSSPIGHSYFFVLSFISVALAVFLVFNFPYRGRVLRTFLGDTGSLFLGLTIGWFSVVLSQEPARSAPPMVFVWLCALFIGDFLCVVTQRLFRKRNPLAADRRHLHHLLLRAGFSVRKTCMILVAFHSACSLTGLTLWKLGVGQSPMLVLGMLVLSLLVATSVSAPRWVPKLKRRHLRAHNPIKT